MTAGCSAATVASAQRIASTSVARSLSLHRFAELRQQQGEMRAQRTALRQRTRHARSNPRRALITGP